MIQPGPWIALAAATLLGTVGCSARGPEPAAEEEEEERPEIVLRTEHDDTRAGRQASEDVAAALGLVDDPELTAYVDAVGQRLARNAPRGRFEYQFAVVDQDAPNAFALPGGFIYVSRGLLALANDEDELANVLAHEIIHVSQRHAAARQAITRGVAGFFELLRPGNIQAYARDQERVADRLGQGLAAVSGWDPAGMARFLRQLEFHARLELGASPLPRFFDTHPGSTQRAADAAERARIIRWTRRPGIARDRADFLARMEGLTVGGSASGGVFQGRRFLHPDLNFTLRFPDGWATRNTRQAVGALSPRRNAFVVLEFGGPGEDPEAAARKYIEENERKGLRVGRLERVVLAGKPGVRATGRTATPRGSAGVVLTWMLRGKTLYRLTGMALEPGFEPTILNVARSFRPLTRELALSVTETRLRIVEARPGESLRELTARTDNTWDLQRTAVMNDLFVDRTLESGQLVKVAVSQAYRPAPPDG